MAEAVGEAGGFFLTGLAGGDSSAADAGDAVVASRPDEYVDRARELAQLAQSGVATFLNVPSRASDADAAPPPRGLSGVESCPNMPIYAGSSNDRLGYGAATHVADAVLQQRASQRARSKLVAKVRSHHGLSATLGGHTRATDAFLLARDEASRLARPLPNWHALPLRPLAPLKKESEAARRKGRESFY